MKYFIRILFCVAPLLAAGCATSPATSLRLPKERATECYAHCDTLGMDLGAVVIIMSSTGCVCEPKQKHRAVESFALVSTYCLVPFRCSPSFVAMEAPWHDSRSSRPRKSGQRTLMNYRNEN